MKKFMAFVFGLLVAFSFVSSEPRALLEAGDAVKAVVDDLADKRRKHRLAKTQKICDDGTHSLDAKKGLRQKTFPQVRNVYRETLEKKLTERNIHISFNCRVFASYAFEKFRSAGVHCEYLRLVFADGSAHDAVLVPQTKIKGTAWYVCDFYEAMDFHDDSFLFKPLTEALSFYNNPGRRGKIASISLDGAAILDENSCMYFSHGGYRDLRAWLGIFAKDEGAALSVLQWEEDNRKQLALKSFDDYYKGDAFWLGLLRSGHLSPLCFLDKK